MTVIDRQIEVDQLKAQVSALEQLLEVYERETLEKSEKLEQAMAELQERAQQLACSEEALQVLQAILESMGDGVVVADEQGKFLFVNPAAEILGVTSTCTSVDQWLTSWKGPYGLFLPDGVTPYPAQQFPLVRAIAGEPVDAAEVYLCDSRGDSVWMQVTARSICDRAGVVRGGVAVFHNVTANKETEEALRQAELRSRKQADELQRILQHLKQTQGQLIQAEKMSGLGQIVAGIAHEINNPINFIYANISPANQYIKDVLELLNLYQEHEAEPALEILKKTEEIGLDFLKEDLPKLMNSMYIGADRIREIVLSLRNFSRLDEAEKKSVDIHEGIENTLLILQHRLKCNARYPEIRLIRRYANLPPVECYAGQLNQVFMNVLANAIDALESRDRGRSLADLEAVPSTITIHTELGDNHNVIIRIRDNGPGIDPDTKKRLFDPFFTTKPVGQGTGLGLYISYQIIVDKHGGKLDCISECDRGTEFRIEVPIY